MSGMRILISPLNWGFGHAGRMIPLALELQKRGNEVIFGAEPSLISLLEKELPGIKIISAPGLRIRYSRLLPQWLSIILQIPRITAVSFREHYLLKRLARELNPDIIISDNRFGFFHKSIRSVYVTHMLRIPFPKPFRFLECAGTAVHRKIISKYDLCLVPDYPGEINLSGRLSHGVRLPLNTVFMGPVSRFGHTVEPAESAAPAEPCCCLILSGPEPQRSLLAERVIESLPDTTIIILTGTSLEISPDSRRVEVITAPGTATMREVITGSSAIIGRSGYTTVMELVSLQRSAVIIPTPGQTEQEYLGEFLQGNHGFISLRQNDIGKLAGILKSLDNVDVASLPDSARLLENAIGQLLEKQVKGSGHDASTDKEA
jgi:UDP-N-acetylglucosamine:LPS N-acetylglucosamine transferase